MRIRSAICRCWNRLIQQTLDAWVIAGSSYGYCFRPGLASSLFLITPKSGFCTAFHVIAWVHRYAMLDKAGERRSRSDRILGRIITDWARERDAFKYLKSAHDAKLTLSPVCTMSKIAHTLLIAIEIKHSACRTCRMAICLGYRRWLFTKRNPKCQ